jgi:hypothetical protein
MIHLKYTIILNIYFLLFFSKLFIDKKHEDSNYKYGEGEDCCTRDNLRFE